MSAVPAKRLAQTAEEQLGVEFWEQPEGAFATPEYDFIYTQVVSAMRSERGIQASSIDLLLIERFAKMYAYQRMREAFDDLNDKTRREMNKDVVELALQLKKLWASDDKGEGGEKLLQRVNEAVKDACQNRLAPTIGQKAYVALMESFDEVGL